MFVSYQVSEELNSRKDSHTTKLEEKQYKIAFFAIMLVIIDINEVQNGTLNNDR